MMSEYRVAESDDGISKHRICITDEISKRSASFAIQVSRIKPKAKSCQWNSNRIKFKFDTF